MEWISLGNSPISEPTGFDNKEWAERYSNRVLQVWLNQLRRTFPFNSFEIKQLKDDSYVVVVLFENKEQLEQAKEVADELPYCWDSYSQKELGTTYFKETRELLCSH